MKEKRGHPNTPNTKLKKWKGDERRDDNGNGGDTIQIKRKECGFH